MTFSIRTFLVVTAILAAWLGALVSNSQLAVELVGNLTALLIVLTLAFAIWDRRPEQRAFWTGFFLLGIANLVIGHYYSGYQWTTAKVATLFLGEPNPSQVAGFWTGGPGPAGPYAPVYAGTTTSYYGAPVPVYVSPSGPPTVNYYIQQRAISVAVPSLMSLVVGCLGGFLTLWIWRQKADDTR